MLKRYEKPVTKAAIASYYAAHKSSFGTPESRDLHLVRTKTAAQAQAAMNALKAGQSWDTVAKKYSADATAKSNGGVLSGVTSGEEEAAVNTAIFGASVNKLVGPVKGVFGYYVLEVTKITPAVQEPLATATKTIKTTLANSQTSTAQTKVIALAKKSFLKQTTCRSAYAVQTVCSNYKAPKTTTSTTPVVTPSTTGTTTSATSTASSTSTGSSTATATTATKTGTTG
jgi:foldase protein PrsA